MRLVRILSAAVLSVLGACSEEPASRTELAATDPAPVQAAPPSVEARAALAHGRELYQAEQPFEALAELQRAAELAPDWTDAQLGLGKLLLTLSSVRFGTAMHDHNRLRTAIVALEKASALDPRSVEAAYWAGQALSTAARIGAVPSPAPAEEKLKAALALDPKHGLACKELGLLYAAEGDGAHAKEYLTRARALLPKDDEVLFQLGVQLQDDGDLDGALAAYLEAVKLNPAHPGPRTKLVSLYLRRGDTAASDKASEGLAKCKEFGKRLTAALNHAQENSRDPAAQVAVGRLYLEREMLEPARSFAERAQRLAPEDPEVKSLQLQIQVHQDMHRLDAISGPGDEAPARGNR